MVASVAEMQSSRARPGLWARAKEYWRRHPTVVVGGGVAAALLLSSPADPGNNFDAEVRW